MNYKRKLLNQVIEQVTKDQKSLVQAALIAKEAATHEESKAEDKYDTRGLEASYLAGAQAKRSLEMERIIFELGRLEIKEFTKGSAIGLADVVTTKIDEIKTSRFFILPFIGGMTLRDEGGDVHVITPVSPLGQQLVGRFEGDCFEFFLGKQNQDIRIINCE